MMRIELGPFLLEERIGKGGMGQVWRGVHAHQGVEVAVKVVTSERAQKRGAFEAFRDEVHAMARLSHPGIIRVFDTGEVAGWEAADSGGFLPEGAPWVAMELARLGTLDRVREGLHWRRLRAVLLSILDALGHAHARGLIHRDLKPGNILLTTVDGNRPTLRLADFGLAQALYEIERGGSTDPRISGTPRYMAPEQIEGKWREQGPWTDLYALGCLSYGLAGGEPPFSGPLAEVLRAHLFEPVPELEPLLEVPEGFEAWAKRLLNKRPRDRFQRAADAAWALLELDDLELDDETDLFSDEGLAELTEQDWSSVEFSATMIDGATVSTSRYSATIVGLTSARHSERSPRELSEVQIFDADLPPLPRGWARRGEFDTSVEGFGAGLGLYGLRQVPLTGRESERDAIWEALHEVSNEGTTRAVILRGSAGVGKSRLAQWGMERAHEVGAAEVFVARHGAAGGATDGLGQMMRRHLKVGGLDREETLNRMAEIFFAACGEPDSRDAYDCLAITEILHPSSEGRVRFERPAERWTVLQRYLKRVVRRPAYVWIDDAQWGADALDFVRHTLEAPQAPATLFVLTVRDEAVTEPASGKLIELARRDDVEMIELGVLPAQTHRSLVAELLRLEEKLAREVAERTDGNPLFALQLVGDWVQRGVLEAGPGGFVLAEGATVSIPDDIHAVWSERVERLIAAFPERERENVTIALHTAAALGQEVDSKAWRRAVAAAGACVHDLLLARLFERGLAEREEEGWRFHHGLLRESLLVALERSGDAARIHGACVEMLRESQERRVDVVEQIATHLMAAGRVEESLEPLLEVAFERTSSGDFGIALGWIEAHDEGLRAIGAAEDDTRWASNWSVAARCYLKMNLVEDARRLIEEGWERSREYGWRELEGEFALHRGNWSRKTGRADEAEGRYREALTLFHDLGDAKGIGRAAYGVAEVLRFKGHFSESVALYEAAVSQLREVYPEGVPVTLQGLASALVAQEREDLARPLLKRALEQAEQFGMRSVMAAVSNVSGEMERRAGNLQMARAAYGRAHTLLESIGSRGAILPKLNIALVDLEIEAWSTALPVLREGVEELESIGELSHLGLLHVCIAVAAAGLEEWAIWDEQIELARERIGSSRAVDPEIADQAERAAELAGRRGEAVRAEAARAIAEEQRALL